VKVAGVYDTLHRSTKYLSNANTST